MLRKTLAGLAAALPILAGAAVIAPASASATQWPEAQGSSVDSQWPAAQG